MKKKILTMIMTAALAASMCTGAFAAEADEEAATAEEGIFVAGFFSDTVTTYYKEAGAVEGIISGVGDHEYAAGTAADLGAYIAVESDLVSAVTYDASGVDFETPGEYRAVYRVFISTEALEDYLEAEADEGEPEDADLGIDSDFIDVCIPATVTIADAGEDAGAVGEEDGDAAVSGEDGDAAVSGVDELEWTFEQMDSIPEVITGIGSITSADDEPEFTADAEIVDAVLYDTRALVGDDPEEVAYFTYFDREALLSYMDEAGIDPDGYPGLSEASAEHIMVYCGPITELDLAGVLEGVTDHYVLIGSENIDYSYGVAYDDTVIKGVTVDSSAVDVTEPGTYTVRYTVTVDTGALAGAADAEDTEDAMDTDEDVSEETGNTEDNGSDADDASGEGGDAEGTDDESNADDDTGGADLKDVVIEKDIDIVTTEEADKLVTGGTAVWTDDNASYGDDEAANGNTKDKDTDEGAEADDSSSDTDTDSSGSSSKSGDTAVKTGTGNSDSSSSSSSGSSSSGSSSSGSSSSKSSSSNSNKSSSSSSSSSSSGSSTASTHTHTWTAVYHPEQGHYEQVLVQAAYDEQVCVGGAYVCNNCGYTTTSGSDISIHILFGGADGGSCGKGGCHSEVYYDTVHHDAVYESKYVVDSAAYTTYVCSGCGATK